ncbi:uncharacterized protein F5147DRAFT_721459 [Suillus discolor]|uniref:Myosin-binding domain-containing protein n=1 Tax=Suillus discolor TaxID=1912936 RepID=A0A9P7EX35_9AGAM|nr:uncharacterized protein F5147DRAFT_721459 [Suillus discolor]KAG2093116.1 hypothetical protein F5147DRAFT_721459 [Suillus discolor]
MAQPYYDGHPLEEYLTDSGEAPEQMPGSWPLFSMLQHSFTESPAVFKYSAQVEKICFVIFGALQFLSSLFTSDRISKRTQAFAERFKYGVITSSLLSPGFATTPVPHPHRRSFSPHIPGRLASNHSRSTSGAESTATDQISLTIPAEPEPHVWPVTLFITLAVAALSARFYALFVLLLVSTLYYMHVHRLDLHSKPDIITPSLEALQNLITAGKVWDAVVQDTLDTLENEERSIFHGLSSPIMTFSSLRVALSTSLLTTQTQCDNVRQLLSAIVSPSELAQLSEMYAPPSPMKLTFSLNNDNHRPLSLPGSRQHDNFTSVRDHKRSTWNGSYSALAQAGSPMSHIAKRREKRRSDLSALLGAASPSRRSSVSAPTSPSAQQPVLDAVEEDDTHPGASLLPEGEDICFGATALDLRRKHRSQGMSKFGTPPRNSAVSLSRSNSDSRHLSTMSLASRYTSMQTSRHPLSFSSLKQSLQSALASKRYACSHLLALRFEGDEDDAYWEDVRSLMGLLTTTLVDASSRLTEVLDEVEEQEQQLEDVAASDSSSDLQVASPLPSPPLPARPLSHSISQINSFAPLPSDLTRFAAHVDAISSALNDARDHLEQCVTSLKEDTPFGHSLQSLAPSIGEPPSHPALLAYERLRREIGLALRECERGRERLTNIVLPPSPSPEEPDDLPTLALDMGSDDSDKPDEASPGMDAQNEDIGLTVISPSGEMFDVDDASSPLLLAASSHHLPPPGIEQVFEAETGNLPAFTRERSKMTREERIKLTRAHRKSGGGGVGVETDEHASKIERWGPGGEVVQELKDVIWKVGERRRRMTEEQLRNAASSIPASSHGSVTPMEIVQQGGLGS